VSPRGLFRIVRPFNVSIAILVVIVSLKLIKEPLCEPQSVIAIILIATLTAFANVLNDYLDRELDKYTHPKRPIVLGEVPARVALVISVTLGFISLFLAYLLGAQTFFFVSFLILLIYLYNHRLKKFPFIGNLSVGVIAGSAFLLASTFTSKWTDLLFPFILAFVFHVGREFLKDLDDLKGDLKFELKTLPVILGEERSLVVLRSLLYLVVLVSLLPIFFNLYGSLYFLFVFLGLDIPLILFSTFLGKGRNLYGKVSTLMNLTILPPLLGFYFGG